MLTPEGPLLPAAALSDDEEKGWDANLPACASVAIANATTAVAPVELRAAGGQPRSVMQQQKRRADAELLTVLRPEANQLERRTSDRGPPPGQPDRRQPRSFGRRPTH